MNPLTVLRKASMKELWQLMLLGMRYPRYIFPSLNATKKALSISQQYYGRAHSKNGPANAFRHAIWNYLIAQDCYHKSKKMESALQWTKRITDFHERLFPNPESARDMDLHNNAFGRNFFKQFPELSQKNLIEALQKAASSAIQIQNDKEVADVKEALVYLFKQEV